MKIKNAIIIHGPGRSGTTLLSSILSLHKDLSWVSNYQNRFPSYLWVSYFNRLLSISAFEKFSRDRKKYPKPSEPYSFWNYYVPEFNDANIARISEKSAKNAISAIKYIQKVNSKDRFVTKITGLSRFQSIEAIFEDPTIIWIDRDPKSVILSYYRKKWRYKNKLEIFNTIPRAKLLEEYTALYRKFQNDKKELERFNLKTFRYEDLVEDKNKFFLEICDFLKLEYSREFKELVDSWDIKQGTNKFNKAMLSEDELNYLTKLIDELE